jgi:hypothetical protein
LGGKIMDFREITFQFSKEGIEAFEELQRYFRLDRGDLLALAFEVHAMITHFLIEEDSDWYEFVKKNKILVIGKESEERINAFIEDHGREFNFTTQEEVVAAAIAAVDGITHRVLGEKVREMLGSEPYKEKGFVRRGELTQVLGISEVDLMRKGLTILEDAAKEISTKWWNKELVEMKGEESKKPVKSVPFKLMMSEDDLKLMDTFIRQMEIRGRASFVRRSMRITTIVGENLFPGGVKE